MLKKIFLILLLFNTSIYAQHTIKGKLKSNKDYSWVILYKLENGKQVYIDKTAIENGKFNFEMGADKTAGVYQIIYQVAQQLFVEFIYNNEDIVFEFDPEKPSETVVFLTSKENKIYKKYETKIKKQQQEIDSLQVFLFGVSDEKLEKETIKKYKKSVSKAESIQTSFEKKSKGKIAYHFIKASKQYNAETPFKDSKTYLRAVKIHFFDAINFKDTILTNTTFVNDRLLDYVFYLNPTDNTIRRNKLHKKAIDKVCNKLDKNYKVLKNFEEDLLQNYIRYENIEMIDIILNQYYYFLPENYQDKALLKQIIAVKKTAIGNKAPDFSWRKNKITKNLYNLIGHDFYMVVFYSTTCPHCKKEIPQLYDFLNFFKNIKVLAIGLEDEKEPWVKMTTNLESFINILDLEKWDSKKVKDYGVTGIPSYFILDSNKNIIAKPYDLEELKMLFQK